MYAAIVVALVALAFGLGYNINRTRDLFKRVTESKEETEVGITNGVYERVDEYAANRDKNIGLVEPKTPQMLEWEEIERQNKIAGIK